MISNEINKLAAVTALSEDIRKWVPDLSQEIRKVLSKYTDKYMFEAGEEAHDVVITQVLTNGVMNALEAIFGNMVDNVMEIKRDGVEEVPPETFKKTVVMALTGLKKRVENEIEEYRKEGVETYNLIVMRTSKESDTGWKVTKEEK